MSGGENVHATGVLLGETGVLLRGPSGSGKSLLALELLERWESRGLAAFLVGDDRIDLALENGQVIMASPPVIAGMIELRGRGIVHRPFRPSATVDLVVELVGGLERMPEADAFSTELLGIRLARCPVPQAGVVDGRHQLLLIAEALRGPPEPVAATAQKTT